MHKYQISCAGWEWSGHASSVSVATGRAMRAIAHKTNNFRGWFPIHIIVEDLGPAPRKTKENKD